MAPVLEMPENGIGRLERLGVKCKVPCPISNAKFQWIQDKLEKARNRGRARIEDEEEDYVPYAYGFEIVH